uniref:Uncharacterized protein n=1 Tax=Setaria italica TaxID=4555 RepID=K3YFH0_SETIT
MKIQGAGVTTVFTSHFICAAKWESNDGVILQFHTEHVVAFVHEIEDT